MDAISSPITNLFSGSSWTGFLQGEGVSFSGAYFAKGIKITRSLFLFLFGWWLRGLVKRGCRQWTYGTRIALSLTFTNFFYETILWVACGSGYYASGG